MGLSMSAVAEESGRAFLAEVNPGRESATPGLQIQISGPVRHETLETEIGTLVDRYQVVTLAGAGAEYSFSIEAARGGRPLLLEVQEIHNRRTDTFGYWIEVNDLDVYFRTYEEYGAGPNHYFVQVPDAAAGTGEVIRITFRSEGAAPFSIGRVWLYEDFFDQVGRPEGMFRPMGLVIPHELMTNGTQRAAYAGLRNYAPVGLLGFAGYGSGNVHDQRAHLDKMLRQSAERDLDVLLLSNGTGWGGMPSGPDGEGGWFSDLRYSILFYDRNTGEYRPSWPGMWGPFSTPTLRDPWLNAFLERRFVKVYGDLRDVLDRYWAGGDTLSPSLIREFAPVSGEVSNFNIETAKADGLVLDPSDGLSREERIWMHRDAAKAWQDFADSTVRVVGRDPVVVDHGTVHAPQEQMLDRLYSQPDFLGTWPVNDVRWNGGQMGMVDGLWSSGEMGQGYDYRDIAMYDYLRARGRLAMINMERTILKENFSVLKNHFARGFHFVCLFNAYPDDAALVRSVDGIDDEPAPAPVHREPQRLDVLMERDLAPGPVDRMVGIDNLRVYSERRLAVDDVSRPGRVVYRLDNLGEPFSSGLNFHVDGRISPGAGNCMVLLGGPSPDDLSEVARLNHDDLPCPDYWTPWMTSEATVDLGEAMIGRKEWYVGVEFHASVAPDETFVLGFQVGSKWPRRSGHVGGESCTMAQSRALQLWTQERVLAERWLEKYRDLGGEDDVYVRAADLFKRGWYGSAYRLLSGEVSNLLPARYLVRGFGRLGRHPVEVRVDGDGAAVGVVLHEVTAEGAEFSLLPLDPEPRTVHVSLDTLAGREGLSLEALGGSRLRVRADKSAPSPVVTLSADPEEPVRKPLPSSLTARFLGRDEAGIRVDMHDLDLMEDNEFLVLPVADDAIFTRSADQLPENDAGDQPQPMDQVELSLDADGFVRSVAALYGRDRGRIRAFHPPTPVGRVSNGVIELENGRQYEIDFSKIHGTRFDTVAMQGINLNYELRALREGIKPGQFVELTYSPYHAPGRLPRVHFVKQAREILLERDFTATTGDEWKDDAIEIAGLDVPPHKPEPNYLYKVVKRFMRPQKPLVPGHVIYAFEDEKSFGETAVEFSARAFEDSSRVTFFVSLDGENWVRCGQFDNTWQNNISQVLDDIPWQFVDLTPVVKGHSRFFLKMELAVHDADERYGVVRLRVATEKYEHE